MQGLFAPAGRARHFAPSHIFSASAMNAAAQVSTVTGLCSDRDLDSRSEFDLLIFQQVDHLAPGVNPLIRHAKRTTD